MKHLPCFQAGLLSLAIIGIGAPCAHAATYSIDAGSASRGTIGFEDDLFNPGGPPPPIIYAGTGAGGTEVNAMSYGRAGTPQIQSSIFYFSVARNNTGAPNTAVNGEAFNASGQRIYDEAADVFVSSGNNTNSQLWDGDGAVANPATPGSGTAGALGLIEPYGPAPGVNGDNVDSADIRYSAPGNIPGLPGASILWSVNPTTAGAGPYAGMSSADIFIAAAANGYSGRPGVHATAAQLGLAGTDDIDGLVYFEDGQPGATNGDTVLFSLAPGSPTLTTLGASAADVLVTSPGGGPSVFASAASLGLVAGDDIDGLDVVPEPASAGLPGFLLFGAALLLRRR